MVLDDSQETNVRFIDVPDPQRFVEEEKNRPSCFDNQRDSLRTTHYPLILHGSTTFTLDLSRDQCVQSLHAKLWL